MKDERFLKKSQQGELDAVPMYLNLAKKFDKINAQIADMLRSMAADEGRHASVFRNLSGKVQKPRQLLATAVPILMNIVGKRNMFVLIAKNEYGAYDTYAPWVARFPQVADVQADERKHGDMAMQIAAMLQKKKQSKE